MKKTLFNCTFVIVISSFFSCEDSNQVEFPRNGLVAYYSFDGNELDEIENNMEVWGAIKTTDRKNTNNSAYYFDGIDDYITTQSTFDFNYRSISLWFCSNDILGNEDSRVILVQDSPQLEYGAITLGFTEGYLLANAGGSILDDQFITSEIQTSKWYHLVLVRDGYKTRYYLNGKLKYTSNSGTLASTYYPNITMIIGAGRKTTTQFFYGKIDDIAIYNRALTQQEILQLYNL